MTGSPRASSALAAALLTVLTTSALVVAPAQARPLSSVDVRVAVAVTAAVTAAGDTDGDGIDDATDGCPSVASTNPTGCPTVKRSARLRYLAGKNRLQARIVSSATACFSRSRVKLWRVAAGGDVRAQVETASSSGRRRFRVPRDARYYVTISSSYAPGIAECAEATSRAVLVPRPS